MKRIAIIVILVLSMCHHAVAQKNITISGTTANAVGKTIELYNYSDKISQTEVLLDRVTIDEDQNFELKCFARYPMLVFLQIDNYSQSFYVEPGSDYKVHIGQFDWNVDETKNVYLDPVTLPVEFLNVPANDINLQINRLDKVIDDYITAHQFYFDQRFKPNRKYFDSLMVVVNKKCPDTDNEFFNRYKKYHLAELQLNMKFASRRSIFNQYIKGQPVLSYDENYMSLFTNLYSYAISKGTKDINVYRLAHWVYNLDYTTYMDSIGIDPMLRHEQVRELAALLALKESYYNFRYYDSKMVVKMIERIAQKTKFEDHKPIAHNIIKGFHKQEAGTKVQSFRLPNVDKDMISLNDFKGMWTYVAFVRVGDPNSEAELEIMAHFKDSIYAHNDNVNFVTIDCNREFQKMYHFLKNTKHGNRYNWIWLHFNNEFDLLRQYGICSYPWFVLIGPDGRQYYDITPAPSAGFLLSPPWKNAKALDDPSGNFFEDSDK